jgi:UPF0042 nucleotide-binding protein
MNVPARPDRILLVTGLSGAGKSTALKTFEDLGWEVVDNLPLRLLDRLLDTPTPGSGGDGERPLAFGIDSRTRDFDPGRILRKIEGLREREGQRADLLFLDCAAPELERRFSETRRRHPLALDRPVADGILREHDLLEPLRASADIVIDTTDTTTNGLQQAIRSRFGDGVGDAPTLTIQSFGFARGVPRNADLVFDMRFLRNPHWDDTLRPMSGLDAPVGAFVREDSAFAEAVERIDGLLNLLLPRYHAEGKSYVTVAFGCTGGRHRSVHVAEEIAKRLRSGGFSPTISHRDLVTKKHGTPGDDGKGREGSRTSGV